MTTTPNFDDLTPPAGLVRKWCQTEDGFAQAARWGARHGWEQARQLWPEPITDRPPTEADGDDDGAVQYLHMRWWAAPWQVVAKEGHPWQHTPRWQPRQLSLQEQALNHLAHYERAENDPDMTAWLDTELIRRALLAAPEAVGVADEDRNDPSWHELWDFVHEAHGIQTNPAEVVAVVRAALIRYAHPAPVPVGERPILKTSNFNDAEGRCWCGTKASVDERGDLPVNYPMAWELREPCAQDDCVLPHWTLPLPGDQP